MLRIIAGKFKGRLLLTPKVVTTRPTQGMLREAVFNICQGEVENASVLDLYAGSGAIGFEALSRGASHVVFIEKNKSAILSIRKNIEALDVSSQTTLLAFNAQVALKKLKEPFDLIYVDPPYDLPIHPILEEIIQHGLLKKGGSLFVEERYNPKEKPNPFSSPLLCLKSSRKFGTAILHQYIIS